MSGGTRKNITSVAMMEAEAKEALDSISCKLIHNQWLEVERCLDAFHRDRYEYRYGKRNVTRDEALRLMRTRDHQ